MKILLVEDDVSLNEVLKKRLVANGFMVDTAFDGEEALAFMDTGEIDLIISDIMMPRLNGLELLKILRQRKNKVPILLLTAKDKTDDIVKGLDMGADDYMVKPFEFAELLARIRLLTRRSDGECDNTYKVADLALNTLSREVKRGEKEIKLTYKEYELLLLLMRNKNKILSREQIMNSLYDWDNEIESNAIDVYIRYLRKKLDDGNETKLIQTVRGVGYGIKG